jgi:serine/threonine protein kinase
MFHRILQTCCPCLTNNDDSNSNKDFDNSSRYPLLSGGGRFLNDRINNATNHASFLYPTSCEGHGPILDMDDGNNNSNNNETTTTSSSTIHNTVHSDESSTTDQQHRCTHTFTDVYTIKEQVGRGSTSSCFKAVHKRSGDVLAVKVIDKRRVAVMYPELLRQFREEVQVLSMLSHPHIIRLYEVFENETTLNVVTEYVQGGELFDYLVERPDRLLSEAEASFIVRQVAWATAYMHAQGVMHRDLKLENILVSHRPSHDEDGPTVKLIDFGLAKRYTQISPTQQQELQQLYEQQVRVVNSNVGTSTSSTSTTSSASAMMDNTTMNILPKPTANTFFGTVGYIAPEMTKRKGYTASVDVWSLGVMTYVLLCGIFPFEDSDPSDLSSALRSHSDYTLKYPPWANKISNSAKDLLSKLLEVNPSRRLTAGRALQHPWVSGETASKNAVLGTPKLLEAMRLNHSYGSPTTYVRPGTDSIASLYVPPEAAEALAESLSSSYQQQSFLTSQQFREDGSSHNTTAGTNVGITNNNILLIDGGVSPLALDKRKG